MKLIIVKACICIQIDKILKNLMPNITDLQMYVRILL